MYMLISPQSVANLIRLAGYYDYGKTDKRIESVRLSFQTVCIAEKDVGRKGQSKSYVTRKD